jgi:isopenicillin-N N-acyltransferase like protein
MSQDIPILELKGTPYEMGLAHGRALREQIVEFAASITAVHQGNNTVLSVTRDVLSGFCTRNLGFLEKFSGALVEEMRGIADGAGVAFEDILYLNSFLELEDLRAPGRGGKILPDALWGCTTFNVTARATADGSAYIGQTYDMEKFYEKYLAILRMKPQSGPDMLLVTLAGILGLVGLNAAGVGAVINKVVATDARPGVIYPFIMRKALAAERIGDALGTVVFSPRASGLTYQLAGGGAAFCAETSATHYELLEIDDVIAHTNYFAGGFMRRYETPHWLSHGGAMVRQQIAGAFLKERKGALTLEMLKELTRDHTNHPRCICAHGFPGEPDNTAFHTIFAVIMNPAEGRLEFCRGNPCQNEYKRHALQ